MTDIPAPREASTARPPLARAPVVAYSAAFAIGLASGVVMLIADADTASSGAGVAVANAVHVVIALVTAAVIATAWRRDPAGLRTWARTPFTRQGSCRTVDALVGVPVGVAELVLLALGRRGTVARIEAWRTARLGTGRGDTPRARRIASRLPVALVGGVAAVLSFQAIWRAGLQVFAALDSDFTRDAWGGPSYLGASLAHWMDGALMFAGCSVVIGLAARGGQDT